MKVRNGFVSNSSSASFIVTTTFTPAQLLKEMIPIIHENKKLFWGELWCDEYDERFINPLLDLNALIQNGYGGFVRFAGTTNYETRIERYAGNTLTVNTCNNDKIDKVLNSIPGVERVEWIDED